MRVLGFSTMLLAALFTQACSPSAPPVPPPPPKTVLDPMRSELDRARGVQSTVERSADDTRKAIDAQERGDSTP